MNTLEGTNEETVEKPKLAALINAKNVQVDQNIQKIEDSKEDIQADESQSDAEGKPQ